MPNENLKNYNTTGVVIEVATPNSRTRFHDPSDAVAFQREKYEEAKKEANRQVEFLHAKLPNPRRI